MPARKRTSDLVQGASSNLKEGFCHMASTRLRFREKLVPQPKSGSVKIGVMEKIRKSDNVVVQTTPFFTGGGSVDADIRRCWDQVNIPVTRSRSRRPKRRENVSYDIILVPRLDADGLPMFKRTRKGLFIPIMRRKRVVSDVSTVFESSESTIGLSLDKDRGYRDGGNFASLHGIRPDASVIGAGTYRTVPEDSNNSFYWRYTGGFSEPGFGSSDLLASGWQNLGRHPGDTTAFPLLDAYGTQAYARLRPRLEKAGLMVALREAKDIPRMLQTTAKFYHDAWQNIAGFRRYTSIRRAPKEAANQFLNHYFGWVPFVNDLVSFDDVYQNSEKYIEQITRDNNSWVKRKRVMEYTESVTPVTSGGTPGVTPNIGAFPFNMLRFETVPGVGSTQALWSIREETLTRVWAMGSFKYYRPEFDASLQDYSSQWNDLQRRLKVYGAEISPTNVYKSTPWTWLIDWFSNVGDHIDQVNDILIDDVASRYMYVMRHWVRRLIFSTRMHYWQGPLNFEWNRFIETKQRQRASSSFGFTLATKNLSPKQWSILAALGLSRSTLAARS